MVQQITPEKLEQLKTGAPATEVFAPAQPVAPVQQSVVSPAQPSAEVATFNQQMVEAPPAAQPEIVNKTALQENIQGTLRVSPGLPTNDEFIQGVSKFATNAKATQEALDSLRGKTVGEVISFFEVGDQFQGMGVTGTGIQDQAQVEKEQIPDVAITEEAVVEEPTTVERIKEQFKALPEIRGRARQEGRETFEVEEKGELVTTTKQATQNARAAQQAARRMIEKEQILDAKDLLAIENKPIPMTFIRGQMSQLSQEQKLDLMLLQNEYNSSVDEVNNALINEQIAVGAYNRAEDLAREFAQDSFDVAEAQLEYLLAVDEIDQRQASEVKEKLNEQKELALNGFIKIEGPSQLAGLTEEQIFRMPGTNDIYKKPEGMRDIDPQIIEADNRRILVDKNTGDVIQDFGVAKVFKSSTGGGRTTTTVTEEEVIIDPVREADIKFYVDNIISGNPSVVDSKTNKVKISAIPSKLRADVQKELEKRVVIEEKFKQPTQDELDVSSVDVLKEVPGSIKKGVDAILNLF